MAWTPPSKLTVIITFLLLAAGLFILVELFFAPLGGILPALNIGTFTSGQWWGIIGMTLVFLAWFLLYLGVRMKGL